MPVSSHRCLCGLGVLHPKPLENILTVLRLGDESVVLELLHLGKSEHFEINGYKKHCLENGLDDVDFLVQNRDKVEAWEAKNK